ncbi:MULTISPECIES: hypothetical protein [unclassified Modicisalibacter]|uniref:hypothetical protein n=1 Tax=unclassified Modicisalibacter TaxID=2679913 RepID=UPI001CCA56A4|nr:MULTISPECIES: hypothetical protein [unclassified Modicisalibacter]MBZ9559729.1 hypothetical protein [Modicisalibacter sp. R2A 31.J]MBZ9577181.1 hypothetical protein [Modicisalibacter sp. MOD 31.J]
MTPRNALVAGLLLLALLPWLQIPQHLAQATLDESLNQAFAAFAIAKGLNATISVLQSSTVDLQVFQITPGEALDPANDMIERFSWVMFAATGSLALQKLLLAISASTAIKTLASGACLLAAALVALKTRLGQSAVLKLAMACLFLRFAVLLVALASGLASQAFLDAPRSTTMNQLETTQTRLEAIADERIGEGREARGWWQQLKDSFDGLVGNPVESVVDGFNAITDKVIDLTMIFITQTILFPLGFLYLLYRLGSPLFGTARLALDRHRLPSRK